VSARKPARVFDRSVGIIAAVTLCMAAIGCSGGGGTRNCGKPREYQASESAASLEVPEDLDAPDRSGKLIIPNVPDSGAEAESDQPCLEEPPDYFDRKL
jgi:uncharacterized lipoprotein